MTEDELNSLAIEIGAKLPNIVRELIANAGVPADQQMPAIMSALVVGMGTMVQIWTTGRPRGFREHTLKQVMEQVKTISKPPRGE